MFADFKNDLQITVKDNASRKWLESKFNNLINIQVAQM